MHAGRKNVTIPGATARSALGILLVFVLMTTSRVEADSMDGKWLNWNVVVVGLIVCVSNFVVACEIPGEIDGAIAGLKQVRDQLVDLKGSGVEISRKGNAIYLNVQIDFILAAASQRIVVVNLNTGEQKAHAQSRDKGYLFNLRRTAEDDKFAVHKLEQFRSSGESPHLKSPITRWLHSPYYIYGRSIIDILEASPEAITGVKVKENSLLEVSLNVPKVGRKLALENCKVYLMPASNYCIHSFTAQTEIGGVDSEVEYFEDNIVDGIRLPKRIVQREWDGLPGSSKLLGSEEFEFTELKTHVATADDFTLASFGLPEVSSSKMKQSNFRLGFYLFAFAVFLLTIFLMRKNKRKIVTK